MISFNKHENANFVTFLGRQKKRTSRSDKGSGGGAFSELFDCHELWSELFGAENKLTIVYTNLETLLMFRYVTYDN